MMSSDKRKENIPTLIPEESTPRYRNVELDDYRGYTPRSKRLARDINRDLEWRFESLLDTEDTKAFLEQFKPFFWIFSGEEQLKEKIGAQIFTNYDLVYNECSRGGLESISVRPKEEAHYDTFSNLRLKPQYEGKSLLEEVKAKIYICPGDQAEENVPLLSRRKENQRFESDLLKGVEAIIRNQAMTIKQGGTPYLPILSYGDVQEYAEGLPWIRLRTLRIDRLDVPDFQKNDITYGIIHNMKALHTELVEQYKKKGLIK